MPFSLETLCGGRKLLKRGGDEMYITFSELIALGVFVIQLIALIVQIKHK